MPVYSALELRKGLLVDHQGRVCTVIDWVILRNDRRQNVRLTLKDVLTGRITEMPKESTDAKYTVLEYENVPLEHSYRDGPDEVFYDANGTEWRCAADGAADALLWQCETYQGFVVDGNLMRVSTPSSVIGTIEDTAPPIKGAGTGTKDAILSNGVKVRVSQLCQNGDRIRLDAESLEFRERV